MAAAACKAVAAVVAADTAGETLLEVVQLVADLVKARDCRCKPEVLHVSKAMMHFERTNAGECKIGSRICDWCCSQLVGTQKAG